MKILLKSCWALLLFLFFASSNGFALSTIAEKEAIYWDLVLEQANLTYAPPTRFQPTSLANASEDASYWINQVLPYEQYRYEDKYLVIPQLWLVTPIVEIPKWTTDFTTMVNGWEIDINKYLNGWIIEYANSVEPGRRGKRVDFGHSNFFTNKEWDFKSIFGSLMRVDVNDQFRYFQRNSSGEYDLFKYVVTESYNTDPYSGVWALSRDGDGADALVFWCTYWLAGRWMLQWTYLGEPIWAPFDPYEWLDSYLRSRIDTAIIKIGRLQTEPKKYAIVQSIKLLNKIRDQFGLATVSDIEDYKTLSEKELIVQYIEDELVRIYPD